MKEPLHFEVYEKTSQRADHINSLTLPTKYPSFVLVFNDDWNDYSYHTWFALWYCESPDSIDLIGELKIINDSESLNIYEELPRSFDEPLPSEFCSLGISSNYYLKLITLFSDKSYAYQVLRYLRDVAIDVNIREKFELTDIYKTSLLRDYSSEKALKEARLILEDRVSINAFSFDFRFNMPYKEELITRWKVKIDYKPKAFNRIFGIIGENGVGKTAMLKQFTRDFIADENKGFRKKPLFNCLTVISSVSSDDYPESEPLNTVPYIYYHLDQNPGNKKKIIDAVNRITQSKSIVEGDSKVTLFLDFIKKVIKNDNLNSYVKDMFRIEIQEEPYYEKKYILNEDVLNSFLSLLSSGQLHVFAMATFLISDMHLSSLIIIDEPEVHLHPSSMVDFMYFLYTLLQMFDSYAIIATHSPLIIREILNPNVYHIIRTEDNIPLVSKVAYDTFGEDIDVLYNKIFNYNEFESIFSITVKDLVSEGKDAKAIEEELSTTLPMNLNARLRISDIVRNNEDNE